MENDAVSRAMIFFNYFSPCIMPKQDDEEIDHEGHDIAANLTSDRSQFMMLVEYSLKNTNALIKILDLFYPKGTLYVFDIVYRQGNTCFTLEKFITKKSKEAVHYLSRAKITKSKIDHYSNSLCNTINKVMSSKHCQFLFNCSAEQIDFDIHRLSSRMSILINAKMFKEKYSDLKLIRIHKKADLFFTNLFKRYYEQESSL